MPAPTPHYLRVAQALALVGEAVVANPCAAPTCWCPPGPGDAGLTAANEGARWEALADGAVLVNTGGPSCTDTQRANGCANVGQPGGPLPPPALRA